MNLTYYIIKPIKETQKLCIVCLKKNATVLINTISIDIYCVNSACCEDCAASNIIDIIQDKHICIATVLTN